MEEVVENIEEVEEEASGQSGQEANSPLGEEGVDTEEVETAEKVDEQEEANGQSGQDTKDTKEAANWVKDLRKKSREDQRRIRELEEQIKGKQKEPEVLGKKPDLHDFDYDSDNYDNALLAWADRKRYHEEVAAKKAADEAKVAGAWKQKLDDYAVSKHKLNVQDYEEAELEIQDSLNITQQGILVQWAKNPALLVYALWKDQNKTKELSSITDPVGFAIEIKAYEANLEANLKDTNRKPPPEKVIARGTSSVSGAVDSTLERLRAEAEKTGDYTKVMSYRRTKRQQN